MNRPPARPPASMCVRDWTGHLNLPEWLVEKMLELGGPGMNLSRGYLDPSLLSSFLLSPILLVSPTIVSFSQKRPKPILDFSLPTFFS